MKKSVSENLKSLGAVKSVETVTSSFCQILKIVKYFPFCPFLHWSSFEIQLVTVWSIFVIVICILQFLNSLNMKFFLKNWSSNFFQNRFWAGSWLNYDSAVQLVCLAPKIFCCFISGLLLQPPDIIFYCCRCKWSIIKYRK